MKFFGDQEKFILSIDSGPSSTIFISEWASLNRAAELELPRKKGKIYETKSMHFGYCKFSSTMYIIENLSSGYRLLVLSFKEFSVKSFLCLALTHSSTSLTQMSLKMKKDAFTANYS